jgi:hypothetical protein
MTQDPLSQQLRNILDAMEAETALFKERAATLEQMGWRIIDGGPVGIDDDGDRSDYVCTDWRTGETLFSGRGTYSDFTAAVEAGEARDGRQWCLLQDVALQATEGEADPEPLLDPVHVQGIPGSLVRALVEWAETATTEELAGLTGLPAERVEYQRREARR